MKKTKTPPVDAAQISLFSSGDDAVAASPEAVAAAPSSTAPPPLPPGEGGGEGELSTVSDTRSAPISSITAPDLLTTLTDWADRHWLRRLDAALARFIAETSPGTDPAALLAIALTAHMEGEGHACVDLHELVTAAEPLLAWKPEPQAALAELMARLSRDVASWHASLLACAAVAAGDPSPSDPHPLVLSEGRLYLRRYWDYERRVAEQVGARVASDEPIGAESLPFGPLALRERDGVRAVRPEGEGAPRLWLDRLFGAPEPGAETDWQKVACAIAMRGRFAIVTGGPGTGKTYTAARLIAALFAMAPDRARFRVALAAPTGKAAARLKQAIDGALEGLQDRVGASLPLRDFAARIGPAKTLHSLLGARPDTRRFRHDAAHPLELDVLVVDEASMVHLEMMAALLDALPPHARIVLLGDKDQLASVEAGAVLGELCRDASRGRYTADTARYVAATTGLDLPPTELDATGPALAQRTVLLRASQRFGGAIGALASAVNAGDREAASASMVDDRDAPVCWCPAASPAAVVELAVNGRAGAPGGYRTYLDAIAQRPTVSTPTDPTPTDASPRDASPRDAKPTSSAIDLWARRVLAAFDEFRVLCAVRDGAWGVAGLNRAIEKALREGGALAGQGEWYEGRPVIVSRNDKALGVFNGDIGIALRPVAGANVLRAYFVDGDAVRSVAVSRFADVETAFAMTVHKSQGSEFAHTVLVLPPDPGFATSRELVYTGITRARSALTLVAKTADVFTDAIAVSARRTSGLHDRLLPTPSA